MALKKTLAEQEVLAAPLVPQAPSRKAFRECLVWTRLDMCRGRESTTQLQPPTTPSALNPPLARVRESSALSALQAAAADGTPSHATEATGPAQSGQQGFINQIQQAPRPAPTRHPPGRCVRALIPRLSPAPRYGPQDFPRTPSPMLSEVATAPQPSQRHDAAAGDEPRHAVPAQAASPPAADPRGTPQGRSDSSASHSSQGSPLGGGSATIPAQASAALQPPVYPLPPAHGALPGNPQEDSMAPYYNAMAAQHHGSQPPYAAAGAPASGLVGRGFDPQTAALQQQMAAMGLAGGAVSPNTGQGKAPGPGGTAVSNPAAMMQQQAEP